MQIVTPYLLYKDVDAALEFLSKAIRIQGGAALHR